MPSYNVFFSEGRKNASWKMYKMIHVLFCQIGINIINDLCLALWPNDNKKGKNYVTCTCIYYYYLCHYITFIPLWTSCITFTGAWCSRMVVKQSCHHSTVPADPPINEELVHPAALVETTKGACKLYNPILEVACNLADEILQQKCFDMLSSN